MRRKHRDPCALSADTRRALEEAIPTAIPFTCAFLSGSAAEGLATPRSDFDVYTVVDGDSHAYSEERFFSTPVGFVEITILPMSKIRDVARKIEVAGGHMKNITDNDIPTEYELRLAHRICTGIPLARTAGVFNYIQGLIDKRLFAAMLQRNACIAANKYLSDASGNIAVKDFDSAIFNSLNGAVSGLDALLHSKGSTSTIYKWRSRYAKRFLGERHRIWRRYLQLCELPATKNAEAKKRYFADASGFVQDVFDELLSDSRFGPGRVTPGRSRARMGKPPAEALYRSPFARIMERESRLYLIVDLPVFEVNDKALAVWLLCTNGARIAQVKRRISSMFGTKSDALVDQCLEAFMRAGALSTGKSRAPRSRITLSGEGKAAGSSFTKASHGTDD